MTKSTLTILFCFILFNSFGQTTKKISTYLSAQYNKTTRDITLGNNPWGGGLGLQAYLNNKSKWRPTIEITGDLYMEDDKVLRMDDAGKEIPDVRAMVNVFGGTSFQATKNIYLSVVAGPSFTSSGCFGLKPSIGFYFCRNQRFTAKFSYLNVFNRDQETHQDFSSYSLSLGVKLF